MISWHRLLRCPKTASKLYRAREYRSSALFALSICLYSITSFLVVFRAGIQVFTCSQPSAFPYPCSTRQYILLASFSRPWSIQRLPKLLTVLKVDICSSLSAFLRPCSTCQYIFLASSSRLWSTQRLPKLLTVLRVNVCSNLSSFLYPCSARQYTFPAPSSISWSAQRSLFPGLFSLPARSGQSLGVTSAAYRAT